MSKLLLAILAICMPLSCVAQTGANPTALEKKLLAALQVNDKGDDRRGNAEQVIHDYAAAHLIDSRRTERSDFDDFYVLRKPAMFLGHDLLVISWGYGRVNTDGPTGCCADTGLTVFVRVNGGDANLVQFAETNHCLYQPNENLRGFWKEMQQIWSRERPPRQHPPIQFPDGQYARLECTDRMLENE